MYKNLLKTRIIYQYDHVNNFLINCLLFNLKKLEVSNSFRYFNLQLFKELHLKLKVYVINQIYHVYLQFIESRY